MSVWFRQYVVYGYKTTYDRYKKYLEDNKVPEMEEDMLRVDNNSELENGWIIDGMNGEFAFYGRIILEGEDNGNDNLLAAESGLQALDDLTEAEMESTWDAVAKAFPEASKGECKLYIMGLYS